MQQAQSPYVAFCLLESPQWITPNILSVKDFMLNVHPIYPGLCPC